MSDRTKASDRADRDAPAAGGAGSDQAPRRKRRRRRARKRVEGADDSGDAASERRSESAGEGAASDGATSDGATSDGATSDGATSEGASAGGAQRRRRSASGGAPPARDGERGRGDSVASNGRRRSRRSRDRDDWRDDDRDDDGPAASGRARDLSGADVTPSDRIPRHKIDQDALRVVSRLARRGFEAYLVGGCVRDLLVGREPKDFDVATEAHPRQIKRIFRNGRIIGRRFKLVHVVYGDHIVETSTFRAAPSAAGTSDDGDLLIVDDNEFGTAAEDARRRDFTINALFLDPLENRLIDFVGGLEDLERRQLRTIGDPYVRLAEDPVRILRAIKFATRLGFDIEERTWNAMCDLSQELERSAPPRVVEEILRLLRSGYAAPAFQQLDECGALGVLCPEIADWLEWARSGADDPDYLWRLLTDLDQRTRRGKEPSISLSLAVLFAPLAERIVARFDGHKSAGDGQIQAALADLLEPIGAPSRLSRRDLGLARRMLANQSRFSQPSSKRFRPLLFMRSPDFEPTLELFHLRVEARDEGWDLLESWQQRYRAALEVDDGEIDQIRSKRRRRRRRRPSGDGA